MSTAAHPEAGVPTGKPTGHEIVGPEDLGDEVRELTVIDYASPESNLLLPGESLPTAIDRLAIDANVDHEVWTMARYLLDRLEVHSPRTYEHCLRTGYYRYGLARFNGREDPGMALVAACLHDVGKLKVDPAFLETDRPLSPEEFEEVKPHAQWGYELLIAEPQLAEAAFEAGLHHKFQKGGYGIDFAKEVQQRGLDAEALARISSGARLMRRIDVFDTVMNPRYIEGAINKSHEPIEQVFADHEDELAWLTAHRLS